MDALESLIESVQDGKGRYGLCDACVHRQGDYCLFIICTGEARTGKPLLLPKSLKE